MREIMKNFGSTEFSKFGLIITDIRTKLFNDVQGALGHGAPLPTFSIGCVPFLCNCVIYSGRLVVNNVSILHNCI